MPLTSVQISNFFPESKLHIMLAVKSEPPLPKVVTLFSESEAIKPGIIINSAEESFNFSLSFFLVFSKSTIILLVVDFFMNMIFLESK